MMLKSVLFASNLFRPHYQKGFRGLNLAKYQNIRLIVTKSNVVDKEKLRKIKPIGYPLLIIPVAAFCLGVWQVRRRRWKLDLIAQLERLTRRPPVPLPTDQEKLSEMEYTPVVVRGHFDHTYEIHMQPRGLVSSTDYGMGLVSMGRGSNTGAWIITPFVISDTKQRILINRGWVPRELINPERRKKSQVTDEIEVVGLVRKTESRPQFRPQNDVEHNVWNYRDVDTMAYYLGTESIFLDARRESTIPGGPIGGQTKITLRNEHFSYIVTWFSLCFVTSYMWYARYWPRTRALPKFR